MLYAIHFSGVLARNRLALLRIYSLCSSVSNCRKYTYILRIYRIIMKFHFLGGLDCPDWILAEISGFSKMTQPGIEACCIAVIDHLKYAKMLEWSSIGINELRQHSEIGARGAKAMLAALSFIVEKAAKNECPVEDLEKEMLQLGFQPEHAKQIAINYSLEKKALTRILHQAFIKAPALSILKAEAVTKESGEEAGACPLVSIKARTSVGELLTIEASTEQLRGLKAGLTEALTSLQPYIEHTARE